MAKCGYVYRGEWRSSEQEILDLINKDYKDVLDSKNNRINGVTSSRVESLMEKISTINIVKDSDVVPKTVKGFDRVIRVLRRFKFKQPAKYKKGGFKKVKFNSAEKKEIISSIQGLILEKFLNQFQDESFKDIIDDLQYESLVATIEQVHSLATEAYEYALTLEKDSTEYNKVVQYQQLLMEILENDGTNDIMLDILTSAFDRTAKSLGFTISDMEAYDEADERANKGNKDSFVDKDFHIRQSLMGKVRARLKAKFMLFNTYELDSNDEPIVSRSILGTPLRYDSHINNATFIAVSEMLAKDTYQTIKSKISMLTEYANMIVGHPTAYLEHYFILDLLDSLKGKGSVNFDKNELFQINKVMNSDSLNMKGLDKITKKKGVLALMIKDFRFHSVFQKAVSNLKAIFDDLKQSKVINTVLDLYKGHLIVSKLKTANTNKAAKVLIEQLLSEDNPTNNIISTIHLETVSALTQALKDFTSIREKIEKKTLKLNSNKNTVVKYDKQDSSFTITKDGIRLFSEINKIEKAIAKVLASKVSKIAAITRIPINEKAILAIEQGIVKGELIQSIGFQGEIKGEGLPISTVIAKFFEEVLKMSTSTTTPKNGIKTLLNWSISKGSTIQSEAISRITKRSKGKSTSKTVSNHNSPMALNQSTKRLHANEDTQVELSKGIFSKLSRVLSIIKNKTIPWLSDLFTQPAIAGLLPTFNSDIDRADSPRNHTIYSFGSYLSSIDFGFKAEASKIFGAEDQNIDEFIADDDTRTSGVPYRLRGRAAKFTLPAFSDADKPATIDGIDFDSMDVDEKGNITWNQTAINYYTDAVIVPELERMRQALTSLSPKDNGYERAISFFHSALNDDFRVQELLQNINIDPSKGLTSLQSVQLREDNRDNIAGENLQELKKLVNNIAHNQLIKALEEYKNQLVKTGVIVKVGEDYYLAKDLAEIQDFQSLLASNNTKESKSREITAENKQALSTMFLTMFNKLNTLGDGPTLEGLIDAALPFVGTDIEVFKSEVEAIVNNPKITDKVKETFKLLGFGITSESLSKTYDSLDIGPKEFTLKKVKLNSNERAIARAKREDEAFRAIQRGYIGGSAFTSTVVRLALDLETSIKNKKDKKTKVPKALKNNKIDSATLEILLGRYVYGYAFSMANIHQLIIGDMPNFYVKAPKNSTKYDENGQEIEDSELFIGDENYDYNADVQATMDKMSKRLKKEVSPATFAEGGGKIVYINTKSQKRDSHVYTKANGYKVNITDMDTDDGASLSTVKSAIAYMVSEGDITDGQQAIDAEKYLEGEMSEKAYVKEYGVQALEQVESLIWKPRVVGFELRPLGDGTYQRVPIFIKVAETILTKALVGTNKNNPLYRRWKIMTDLENKLNSDKDGKVINTATNWIQVKTSPPSGVKVGGKPPVDVDALVYDEETDSFEIPSESLMTISTSDYGRQVDTLWHEGKQIKPTGQGENLLFNNTTSDTEIEVETDERDSKGKFKKRKVNLWNYWEEVLNESFQVGFDEIYEMFEPDTTDDRVSQLLSSLGISAATNKGKRRTPDEILVSFLKKAMINQNSADASKSNPAIKNWLELVDGKLRWNITESPHFKKYVDVIRKAYEKKTITRKRAGSQVALIPDFGVDVNDDTTGIVYMKGVYKDPSGRLMPTTIEHGAAQVLIAWDITYLSPKGKEIKATMDKFLTADGTEIDPDKLPLELLERFGYRIPTQDYSMTSNIQVIGFLPRGYRNAVIAPAEFTALMGSDFDIDKLALYRKNLVLQKDSATGEVLLNKIQEWQMEDYPGLRKAYWDNKRQEVLQAILSDPKIIMDEIVSPLNGEDTFKKAVGGQIFVKELEKAMRTAANTTDSVLFPSYQENKRNDSAEASYAIAVFAKGGRTYSQLKRVTPKLWVLRDGKEENITLTLGSLNITNFAADNTAYFNREGDPEDSVFTKIKNNFSAMISLAVDNETLQLLHRLGVGSKTYDSIVSLMTLGFRAKTAIAMANSQAILPSKEDLVQAYNNLPNSERLPKISSIFTEENKEGKLVTGSDLSFLSEKTTETEFTNSILKYMDEYKSENLSELTGTEIVNILALKSFMAEAKRTYKHTVQSFNWAVNLDSQGFEYDLATASNKVSLTEDSRYKEVWAELSAIPEMRLGIESMKLYVTKIDELFAREPGLSDVYEYFKINNIEAPNIFDVSKVFRAEKYKHMIPNSESLVARLRVLLNSEVAEVKSYVNSNLFLSRLRFNTTRAGDTTIVFHKDRRIEDEDIVADLNELLDLESVGGIDLALLHYDLIAYGITATHWSYGDNYNEFIIPEFYSSSQVPLDNIDYQKIALEIAFRNKRGVTESDTNNIWLRTSQDGEKILMWRDSDGTEHEYTKKDSNDFKSKEEGEEYRLFEDEDYVEEEHNEGNYVPISADSLAERVLNSPTYKGLKSLLQATFPNGMQIFRNDEVNEWSSRYDTMNLKTEKSLSKLRAMFIHESIHAVLSKAINGFLGGTLNAIYPGTREGEISAIHLEMERILNSLLNGMNDITNSLATKSLDSFKAFTGTIIRTKKGIEVPMLIASINNSMAYEGFNNGFELLEVLEEADIKMLFKDKSKDEIQFILDNIEIAGEGVDTFTEEDSNRLVMFSLFKALKDGNLVLGEGRTHKEKQVLTFIKKDGTTLYGAQFDETSFSDFKTILVDGVGHLIEVDKGPAKGSDRLSNTLRTAANIIESTDSKTANKYAKTLAMIYGLTNLQEFAASVQSYGINANSAISYASITRYESASSANAIFESISSSELGRMFNLIKGVISSVVGEGTTNKLWSDVAYGMAVSKTEMFVKEDPATGFVYTDLSKDIIQKC